MNNPWLRYLGLTAELLVLIGAAVYVGIRLDDRWNLSPALTIILPLLALVGVFYKLLRENNKRKSKK
ncbi:hypothetical protein GCM10027051_05750 [Niabella terrae]